LAARLGGDQLAMLQRGVAVQLMEALAGLADLAGRTYALTVTRLNGASIDLVLLPCDGMNAKQLVKNADLAL
jgi:predicted signal transduction protein with EAL and GGDEF domain